jgi:rubredoxin
MAERETCPVCGNPDAESDHCVDDTYGDYYKAHCDQCGWEFDGLSGLIEAKMRNDTMSNWWMILEDRNRG